MNRLKKIIAWLDWSTYAKSYERVDYEAPKSLCSLFFRVVGIIILLPTTAIIHFSNTFVNFNDYKAQDNSSKYLGSFIEGLILNFLCLISTAVFIGNVESTGLVDIMKFSDPWWFTYIKAMLLGAFSIILTLSLLVGVIWLLYKFVRMVIAIIKYDPTLNFSGGAILRTFQWVKRKTCVEIDWKTIKD